MANIIPPLVSDSPPPPPSEDEEEDEFDDFRESNDLSYGCDSFSITSSPEQSPKKIPNEMSTSKHESEFDFAPDSKNNGQMDDGKLSSKVEKDVNSTIKNNESTISEGSSSCNHIAEDSNDLILKNNFVNKDLDVDFKENIPSQLILESTCFNQEKEICDNSDKINETTHNKSTVLNLINGHTVNTMKHSSADNNLYTNWSADFVNLQNEESHFNSEKSLSPGLNPANVDDIHRIIFSIETSENRSTPIDDVLSENLDTSDQTFNDSQSYPKHSNIETSNLVIDNVEINSVHNESIHNIESHSPKNVSLETNTMKTVSAYSDFKSGDVNFGNFTEQKTSLEPSLNNKEIESFSKEEIGIKNTGYNTIDIKSEEIQDADRENDFTNFSANTVDPTQNILKSNNNDLISSDNSDLDNIGTFVSKNGGDLSNVLETADEEFANFATFSATDEEEPSKESSMPSKPTEDLTISSTYGNFAELPTQSIISNTLSKTEKDDDFEDFATFPVKIDPDPPNPNMSDDEFGEFGDFTSSTFDSQNQPTPGTSTQKTEYTLLNKKEALIKAQEVIKDMFNPIEEVLDDFQQFDLIKDDFIFNQIQDITNTPALNYHWSKSTSQKLLLKSLNIDSRNILYSGHSRNSSVPRFAANLGLQPLEPVKMESIAPTPSPSTPPIVQTTFQAQTDIQEVPNAEFDWTSSGLVNPLDYCQNTLLDLEQLVASLDIPSSSPSYPTLSTRVQEDWDVWLECSTSGPTNSEDSKSGVQADNFEEFTSFQSSEPSQLSTSWPNVPLRETYISEVTQSHIDVDVYLQPTIVTPEMPRKIISTEDEPEFTETNVDVKEINNIQDDDIEFDDFQMSTPVNNKDIESNREINVGNISEENIPNKNILEIQTDDNYSKHSNEFTDSFKVLPDDSLINSNILTNTLKASQSYSTNLNELLDKSVLEISDIPRKYSTDNLPTNFPTPQSISYNFGTTDIFEKPSTSLSTCDSFTKKDFENSEKVGIHDEKSTEIEISHEDDDFTDFHSSVPIPQPKVPTAMPVLEPLKPTVVYSSAPSSQINWPDPGITDDEIKKFEVAFAKPVVPKTEETLKKEKNVEVIINSTKDVTTHPKKSGTPAPRTEFPMWDTSPVHKVHKKLDPKKIEIKQNPSTEEDEWTDFVSVTKPSPVHKTKLSDRNKTSSPDLTLSVLNLGSIQPAKQPIPVITPQGFVQTRLSSSTNSVSQQKSNCIIPKQLPQSQPSIISNQFASQAYNVGFNTSPSYNYSTNPSQSSVPIPKKKSNQISGNFVINGQEDDEWGEFVSSPLPPLQNSSNTPGHHNWNQSVTTSRSNAGQYFNQNQFSIGNEINRSNVVTQKKTSQLPGLVLPELDFLSLRERTGVSKKK
ncbi:aftiphilin isoform X1 [Diorhabda sublineata]|uniref:aftiphilin isoform X1 n=1 Tax=Diorhabda sublineata TaxID=1163346 RepID=UPI0024E16762|nr:aftiphilin isoform X1 [Diorhabda sublineata]